MSIGSLFRRLTTPQKGVEESHRLALQEKAEFLESLGRWRYVASPLMRVANWLWMVAELALILILFLLALFIVPLRFIFHLPGGIASLPREAQGQVLALFFDVALAVGAVVVFVLGAYTFSAMMLSIAIWMPRPSSRTVFTLAAVNVGLGIAIGLVAIVHRSWSDFFPAAFCLCLGLDSLRVAIRGAEGKT